MLIDAYFKISNPSELFGNITFIIGDDKKYNAIKHGKDIMLDIFNESTTFSLNLLLCFKACSFDNAGIIETPKAIDKVNGTFINTETFPVN